VSRRDAFDPARWHDSVEGEAGRESHATFRRGLELAAQAVLAGGGRGALWLDAGCGSGTLSRRLGAAGIRVVGVDSDLAMLAFAATRSAGAARWAAADVGCLPFGNAACDGIAAVSLLGLLADPGLFLRESARVLRPGGRLLLTATNLASWSVWAGMLVGRLRRAPSPAEGGPRRYALHAPARLAARCRAAGLQPVRVTHYGHLPVARPWSREAIRHAEQREHASTRFVACPGARNFLLEAVRPPRLRV
jgi:SAM-dependent methyltransferase